MNRAEGGSSNLFDLDSTEALTTCSYYYVIILSLWELYSKSIIIGPLKRTWSFTGATRVRAKGTGTRTAAAPLALKTEVCVHVLLCRVVSVCVRKCTCDKHTLAVLLMGQGHSFSDILQVKINQSSHAKSPVSPANQSP